MTEGDEMRRALYPSETSAGRQKKIAAGNSPPFLFTALSIMDPLRQPKKRFVGRRTADAQNAKDSLGDVESTTVQKGTAPSPLFNTSVLIASQRHLDAHLGL